MGRTDRGVSWALVAATAAVTMLSASCGSGSTPTAQPTSPAPSTSPATSTPTGTPSPPATPTSPAAFRYQPLWPFTGPAQAAAWQANHPGGGADAWRYDARRTALSFTRDYLHITDVDRSTSARVTATDAHVGVGFATEGGRMGTAAVVHLVRIGAGPDAPWEVVGTDDTTLTLTRPSYGATVGSPTVVGGRVTGVDENLRVKVFVATAVDAVGSACCVAAGGERTPWSMSVPYRASSGQVLTVVVMTGGHLKAVERFAVTGVRAR